MDNRGKIIRLAPEGLRELLQETNFNTGDTAFDTLFNTARIKYLSAHFEDRKVALEKLWDAWERLKSLEIPGDKRASLSKLLEKTTPTLELREKLDSEARALTEIGNQFMIRHTETDKIPITSSDQIDYFFHRLFSLIYLILKSTNRIN
ncbi:MAG: hypothetical protein ABSB80_09000 [Methanoregula sp.]|uniref:hypothetical protein n=1 Tax=Methanoregula sp. TaxID=2052170 RepID=UPI003D0D9A68